ncbi:MAG: peptidoglycan-N-acetylglucosamine deacetylase [Solirubrobacteraceae bacterium]|nr:peptidoglycan-N-acetylglucosamine deacetylase [Solirubrobacteraceae bacterium]
MNPQAPVARHDLAVSRIRSRLGLLGAAASLALVSIPSVVAGVPESESPTTATVPAPATGDPARERQLGDDRAVDRVLARSATVRAGSAARRDLALTFDDGPGPWTAPILRTLERHRAPATFFVIGRQAAAHPELVRREIQDGFAVEAHTQDHARLTTLTASAQRAQIAHGVAAIVAAGAPTPRLFRPPYGAFDATTLRILAAEHRLLVLWSVDTRDYAQPGADRILAAALAGAHPGAILLLHDGGGDRRQTADALARIVHRLRQRRYHLVTVPELMRDDPPTVRRFR